ncbi:MAG: hypothetical protein E7027_03040 [Elusimicrobium sp.]|uniref:Uncharacterized protein n=1 Tax=Candidatus Avelusimicrobium gallicola TaxID=2562704 RepID=A0A928DPL1_9BACT|nr:hypothetical protein [Elusimicrobium sp.]
MIEDLFNFIDELYASNNGVKVFCANIILLILSLIEVVIAYFLLKTIGTPILRIIVLVFFAFLIWKTTGKKR